MQGWLQDVRVGLRIMRRTPGITGVALLTIALGIGATTAVFSLVSGILLKALPYPDSDRLIAVWNTLPGVGFEQFAQSAALHFTYEDQARTLESIGLWSPGGATVTGRGEASIEQGVWVTHGIMEALGMQPVVGRRFTPADDASTAPATVMLGYRYWQEAFGGESDVIGRTLQIDGAAREIIGVTRPGRFLSDYDPALYLPLAIDRSTTEAGHFSYMSLARLAPGVTLEQAVADMTRLVPVHVEAFPGPFAEKDLEESRLAPLVWPLKNDVLGNIGPRLWVIFGAAVLVLLIAVANVANLVLVQAEARGREVAVRTAMGAGRGRLAQQLLVEGTTLGVLGGLLGVGLAYAGLEVIRSTSPGDLPRLNEVSLDPAVLLFTLGLSVLTGIVFGLFPLLRNRGGDLVSALKDGGGGSGRVRHGLRNGLAVAQISVALVLLVGSGLMVRSLQKLRSVDPGFSRSGTVLTLRIGIPSDEIRDVQEVARTHELIGARLSELPGVFSVGLTSKLPMSGGQYMDPIYFEGESRAEGTPPDVLQQTWVGPGYFTTLGIPLLAGRYLNAADAADRRMVIVLSKAVAVEHWGSPAEAIGKRISDGAVPGASGWREIVGVVGDVRDAGITQEPPGIVYWPLVTPSPMEPVDAGALYAPRAVSYAVRGEGVGTPGFLREVREAIASVNPNLPAGSVQTLDAIVARGAARTSFMLVMLGIAAGVAFVLGVVGVYGVVSYLVSRRTRELGLRIALGAHPRAVVRLVLSHGLMLSVWGVGLGLVAAFWMSRVVGAFLFGVDPTDPLTFAVAACSLVPITLLACFIPARRATHIDPSRALRLE
jgi:putative ABC transport system permease protein